MEYLETVSSCSHIEMDPFSSPGPFQHPGDWTIRQHDSEIEISDSISHCPGKEHSGIRHRGFCDGRKGIIDSPNLNRAGKDLGKGCENGGADNSCLVG